MASSSSPTPNDDPHAAFKAKIAEAAAVAKTSRIRLLEKWNKTVDDDGNFEYTFGDPSQTIYAVKVWIGYDENDQVLIDLIYPVVDVEGAIQFGENEGLNSNELGELEGICLDNVNLLDSDIPTFANNIFNFLKGMEPHPSFNDALFEEWDSAKKAELDLRNEFTQAKQMYALTLGPGKHKNLKQKIIDPSVIALAKRIKANREREIRAYVQEVKHQRAMMELQGQECVINELIEANAKWLEQGTSGSDSSFINYLQRVQVLNSLFILYKNCGLTSITPNIGRMNGVHEVNLSENNLTIIPSELFSMPSLKRLYLHDNKLRVLPGLGAATKLELLDLHRNELSSIYGIGLLTKLQTLDVEKNRITELPSEIENLTRLNHLNLANNKVKIIPIQMAALHDCLRYMNLRNNPVVNLPAHIYLQGTRTTMKFLREHQPGNADIAESSLRYDLGKLFNNKFLHDVVIEVQKRNQNNALENTGIRYYAHQIILCARASPLKAIFDGIRSQNIELSKTSDGIPILPLEIESDHLSVLLQYLYNDTYTTPTLNLLQANLGTTDTDAVELANANSQILESFKAQLAAQSQVATRFKLPHLAHLIDLVQNPNAAEVKSTFMSDIKPLFANAANLQADVSFRFPNEPEARMIDAHKALLCSRSQYFSSMLTGGMLESTQRIVNINDVSRQVFASMIEFCYTDDVEELNGDTIMELLMSARLYGLDRLLGIVESVVGYSLDVDNACPIMVTAFVYTLKRLARACKFFILSNWEATTQTEGWQDVPAEIKSKLTAKAEEWGVITK